LASVGRAEAPLAPPLASSLHVDIHVVRTMVNRYNAYTAP
jgi:hypothetical protein